MNVRPYAARNARAQLATLSPAILIALAGLWTVVVATASVGVITVAQLGLVVIGTPTALAIWLVLSRRPVPPVVRTIALWTAVVAAGILSARIITFIPSAALLVPAIAVAGVVATRFPVACVVAVFFLAGTYNVLLAYLDISPHNIADLVLAGLWAGGLAVYAFKRVDRPRVIWAGVLAAAGYCVLTALSALVADNQQQAITSLRTTVWHMMAFLLVAYAPWPEGSRMRIARGFVLVAVLVGAYTVLRMVIGPGRAELELARLGSDASAGKEAGAINTVGDQTRAFGPFQTRHELGAWVAMTIPFCAALALAFTGRWRILAIVAIALSAIGLFGADLRIGLAATVVGVAAVLALHGTARAFPGLRLGATLAALAVGLAVGTGALLVTTGGDSARIQRYAVILEPSSDQSFAARTWKWDRALATIREHPFGSGVGSANPVTLGSSPYITNIDVYIDNTYLMVAFEQGMAVLVLFAAALLMLLTGMARYTRNAPTREHAALAIGGTGVLCAFLVLLYTGPYTVWLPGLVAWMLVGLGVAPTCMRAIDRGRQAPIELP
jgi:hypothetical protein